MATNFVLQLLHLIVGTVRGLFKHDDTTGSASVQFWAVAATVLLLLKFAVGSIGPRFSSRRVVSPVARLLEILNYYAVNYTLGLMTPSRSSQGAAATVNNFFQVWAVLITTMQDSIRIGRPYKPKEMSLIDLLSSLWSANELRAPAPMYLKVPLWLMWSIHAARIIWYYFSFNRAGDAILSNIKLVSDYMMTSQHTEGDACPRTMSGYKYIVFGEDKQEMKVRPPHFTLEMELDRPKADKFMTLETIWKQGKVEGDMLLGSEADSDSRFKDVCLSFALYKLQRRRFYNFPIAEATHPATSQLVSGNILKGAKELADSTDPDSVPGPEGVTTHPATRQVVTDANDHVSHNMKLDATTDRAFRITEVELSFLQDLFYSKHAAVFARGFPYVRLALSQLMTAAALYLVYAVRDIPNVSTAVVTGDGRVARITHGVFVTHCIIAVVVCRELWEVGVYIVSQWTKVWIIHRHMKLTKWLSISPGTAENTGSARRPTPGAAQKWYQLKRTTSWALQLVVLDQVARIMFFVVRRGRWDRRVGQHNMLMSALIRNKGLSSLFPTLMAARTKFIIRNVKLQREVAGAMFQSLRDLIGKIPSSTGPGSSKHPWSDASSEEMNNNLLKSYFKNAFTDDAAGSSSSPRIKDPASELEGETHKILVWHIATSLCQIRLLEKAGHRGDDLYSLPSPFGGGLAEHYVTAVSLSNYCAYLVTEAFVPDNGLVVDKVFHFVSEEVRKALSRCTKMSDIHGRLTLMSLDETTILGIGKKLSDELIKKYGCDEELWKRLAKFWAGFLLHLSASTRAAKHLIHLQGRGELTTHMWVLLSHAGFLGEISHGEQLPDPVDQRYT